MCWCTDCVLSSLAASFQNCQAIQFGSDLIHRSLYLFIIYCSLSQLGDRDNYSQSFPSSSLTSLRLMFEYGGIHYYRFCQQHLWKLLTLVVFQTKKIFLHINKSKIKAMKQRWWTLVLIQRLVNVNGRNTRSVGVWLPLNFRSLQEWENFKLWENFPHIFITSCMGII